MRITRIPVALAILVAAAAAATALPAAAAPPQDVTITSTFVAVGDLTAGTTTGTFSISGAITDGGALTGDYRFAGLGHLETGAPNSIHADQTLAGEQGTISIAIVAAARRRNRPPRPLQIREVKRGVSSESNALCPSERSFQATRQGGARR